MKLKYEFKPDEEFEVKETQRAIYLKEKILNYDRNRPTQTYFEECTWTILVPQGMYITCTGSSGEFEVNGFIGTFKASFASGIFVFNNVDGTIDLSQAMVKAKIHNSKGSFNINSATGYIRAKGLTISGNSNFSTGLGNITISLAQEPEADLYVGSSFNRAMVNFNGHPLAGCFEFICRADEGQIISPFDLKKKRPFWMIY